MAVNKNSIFYALGPEAQKTIIRLRAEGRTLQYIIDYLNEYYKDKISTKQKVTICKLHGFLKRHGQTIISRLKEERLNNLTREFNNTNSLKKLLNYIDETIEYYQQRGDKLSLKDTINAKLRIHELLIKEQGDAQKDEQTSELKTFLNRIQDEFNNPSITAEVEYDEQGNVRKKKLIKKINRELTEEENEEAEAIINDTN